MYLGIIIAAGGTGNRFGSELPKQYLEINGKPLLWYTLNSISQLQTEKEVCLVTPVGDLHDQHTTDLKAQFPSIHIKQVAGGETRFHSVRNGFQNLSPETTHVLIHDAARPCTSLTVFNNVIQHISEENIVIPGTPLKDTIKVKNPKGLVSKTLDRDTLISTQTPQGFLYKQLNKIYTSPIDMPDLKITDESMLGQLIDCPVLIVEGDEDNIKVTYPRDLEYAQLIINSNRSRV